MERASESLNTAIPPEIVAPVFRAAAGRRSSSNGTRSKLAFSAELFPPPPVSRCATICKPSRESMFVSCVPSTSSADTLMLGRVTTWFSPTKYSTAKAVRRASPSGLMKNVLESTVAPG
eukprot:133740-Rhodomonas_salina.1